MNDQPVEGMQPPCERLQSEIVGYVHCPHCGWLKIAHHKRPMTPTIEEEKPEMRAACDDPLCFGDCHPIRNRRPSPSSLPAMKELRALVNEQAEDEGLWFKAMYAPEAYLQQALRLVHDRAEKLLAYIEGKGD